MDKREAIKPKQIQKLEKLSSVSRDFGADAGKKETQERISGVPKHSFVAKENPGNNESIISLLFDIILNKNKDATNKLKLLKEEKDKAKENIEAKIKLLGKNQDSKNNAEKNPADRLKPELMLPKLRYFNTEETPKLDYGSLFSYFGNMFKAKYDEYKAFKYDGEGRVEFEFAVEQRKYDRIVEKEMMAEFRFFALDHIKPEEKEAYEWDRLFGFRKAIIYLNYFMKSASLRVIPGMEYSRESQEIKAINSP